MMGFDTFFMFALSVVLLIAVRLRQPDKFADMLKGLGTQARTVAITAPAGFLIAGFVAVMLPAEIVAGLLGEQSGIVGILLACIAGAFIPGGPMVAFPIVLTIGHLGAGQPQMIAFVTGWSLLAFHRIVSYELPLMGPQFLKVRLISTVLLPPLAGIAVLLLFPVARGTM